MYIYLYKYVEFLLSKASIASRVMLVFLHFG